MREKSSTQPGGFAERDQSVFSGVPAGMSMTQQILANYVELGEAGRFVVPAAMRAAMGVKAGDKLLATLDHGVLRLESQASVIARVQAAVRPLAPAGVSLADELIAERRREALEDTASSPAPPEASQGRVPA